jgi:hypothetical protein
VPIAPVLLVGQSQLPVNPQEYIACLQPIHLHATRDHLVLMGQNQIDLTASESADLLKAVLAFIEEDFQSTLLYQNQHYWFIAAGSFTKLITHSVDQAHGRNIDWWMPRDSEEPGIAKRWRKLQNEIQMLWHIDPVNEAREMRGLPAINSLWISGIGRLADLHSPEILTQSNYIYGAHPLLAGLAKHFDIEYGSEINLEHLAGAFAWTEQPALAWPKLSQALLDKQLDEVLIIDFPHGNKRERIFTAKDLQGRSWAFWRKIEPLSWQKIAQQ